jgi:hypothetical protein
MNITQQRELTAIARQALALLDPDWAISASLQERLAAVLAVKAPAKSVSRKFKKSELYTYKPFSAEQRAVSHRYVWAPVHIEDPADYDVPQMTREADPACMCCGCAILAGFQARGMKDTSNMANEAANKMRFAEAIRDSLKVCACGHDADRHEEDELNNLLKCADCDCEQFHYSEDQKAAA